MNNTQERDGILRRKRNNGKDFFDELDEHMQRIVKNLMSNDDFKEFIAWMLHRTHYFDVPMAMNAQTYFIEGQRKVGQEIFYLIKQSCMERPSILGDFMLYIDKQHSKYLMEGENDWIV